MQDNIVKKILFLLGDDKRKIFFIVFLSLISSFIDIIGLGLIGPYASFVINPETFNLKDTFFNFSFFKDKNYDYIIIMFSIILILVFIIKAIFLLFIKYYLASFIYNSQVELQKKTMLNIQQKDYLEILKSHTSGATEDIQGLVKVFTSKVLFAFMNLLNDIILVSIIFIFLVYTQTFFILILLAFLIPMSILYIYFLRPKLIYYGMQTSKASKNIFKTIKEAIEGFKEITILGKGNFFLEKLISNAKQNSRYAIRFTIISISPRLFLEIIMISFVVCFFLINKFYLKNTDLVSTFAVIAFGIVRLLPSFTQIVGSINNFNNGRFATNKLYNELKIFSEKEIDQSLKEKSQNQKISFENLEIKNLSFGYEVNNFIFSNLNLKINKGDIIGLIGQSGSGKTSLIDIILGLVKSNEGEILINNKIIINDENIETWRKCIAYLPQENFIFDGSIKDNIIFSKDDLINNEKLKEVIQQAEISNFIKNLPERENTMIGEKGSRLSGGQKQRLSLARALYHGKDILILDEALNALDLETQNEILEQLKKLSKNKTFILVTHDKNTLKYCNKILRLENKKIIKE
jgi:ATP-binding cassette, subfamily B, bacterial PglK